MRRWGDGGARHAAADDAKPAFDTRQPADFRVEVKRFMQ